MGDARDILVVGASAGGLKALTDLVGSLPPGLPAAVFVVLHVPAHVPSRLPQILTRAGPLRAAHAVDGEEIVPGRIYVAPPGHHLLVRDGHVHLSCGPVEEGTRPAVNPLFRTAARAYGPRVVGVVLSGALADGTAGLLAVEQAGGLTVVQDPAEASFPSMPRSAIEYVRVDHVLPAAEIGRLLAVLSDVDGSERTLGDIQRSGGDSAEIGMDANQRSQPDGPPSGYTCPECSGAVWEEKLGEFVQYRCRTGHVYAAQALLAAQIGDADAVLASSRTALEEAADLASRMAARARERGDSYMERRYTRQAVVLARRIDAVREALQQGFSDEDSESQDPAVLAEPG